MTIPRGEKVTRGRRTTGTKPIRNQMSNDKTRKDQTKMDTSRSRLTPGKDTFGFFTGLSDDGDPLEAEKGKASEDGQLEANRGNKGKQPTMEKCKGRQKFHRKLTA